MPTRVELEYAGGFLLLLILLPLSLYVDFIPKLWRTWKGKREKSEFVDRSVTK